ncbi:VanZ family protein [Streptomyces sp. NPDC004111]|uniref:VanZ family protein n=1 Tax=Streptomyces sp. NPDC004111 TaxID=3364690 RepID=UPI0036AEA748
MILYITPESVALFVLTVLLLTWFCARWRRRSDVAPVALRFLQATWALIVLAATVFPTEPLNSTARYVEWFPGESMWGEDTGGLFEDEKTIIAQLQIANAVMFVPLGSLFYFGGIFRTSALLRAVLTCLGLSVLIEMMQFLMAAGRIVDIDDVLFNTVGGLAGATSAAIAARLAARLEGRDRHQVVHSRS